MQFFPPKPSKPNFRKPKGPKKSKEEKYEKEELFHANRLYNCASGCRGDAKSEARRKLRRNHGDKPVAEEKRIRRIKIEIYDEFDDFDEFYIIKGRKR